MSFVPFIVLEVLLILSVLALFLWRKSVAREEDDSIHMLHGTAGVSQHQQAISQKLDVIDKWGKIVTAVTVIFGLLLGAAYMYSSFVKGPSQGL